MDPIDSVTEAVARYLAGLKDRPTTIQELVEYVDDPWLQPESLADVLVAVGNLHDDGLLEEHRYAGGCSLYALADDPTTHAPSSRGGEDF